MQASNPPAVRAKATCPPLCGDGALDDSKTEPGAIAAARGIAPREWTHQIPAADGLEPGPGIGYGNDQALVVHARLDPHRRSAVPQCIGKEIADRP